jgi:hypothetical protein
VFLDLVFEKTGSDILAKAEEKLGALSKEIDEAKTELRALCTTLGLETAYDMFLKAGSTDGIDALDAPVHAKTALEDLVLCIHDRAKELDDLAVVTRNLDPEGVFDLDYEAVKYFGF